MSRIDDLLVSGVTSAHSQQGEWVVPDAQVTASSGSIVRRPVVSVVIPVKNAVHIIGRVLDAVIAQDTPWPFEVLVIDSGSKDGTLDVLARYPSVRVLQIPPEEFGHGRTRNLGVMSTSGEYIAFLTHDAIPDSAVWLRNLVAPLLASPEVAGVFGRHISHAGASPCISRDLDLHFEGLRAAGAVLRMDDPQRYKTDPGYRQLLHFYSDNNSCMRRSAWEIIPYPDVDYAEDQLWAQQIIERGYAKAYAHDAVVRHSHDYGVVETFRRSFDESSALRRLFGYVLASSRGSAARNAWGCAKRDFLYTLRHPDGGLIPAIRVAFCQVARQLGYLLGSRDRRLPGWLLRVVSLDARMKYGAFRPMGAIGKFMSISRQQGMRGALSRTLNAASRHVAPALTPTPKVDIPEFFRAILPPGHPAAMHPVRFPVSSAPDNEVCVLWFIPEFGAGSGGHLNIVRFLRGLEERGMSCGIVLVGTHPYPDREVALGFARRYFGDFKAQLYLEGDILPRADAVVATSWLTAYFLRHYTAEGTRKFYFIQDYEPMFYAAGFDAVAAKETYHFGFGAICAGGWIADMLRDAHGVKALGRFGFSYDKQLYRAIAKRDSVRRVFFYVRPPTARRGFELGMLALDLVGRICPDVEFIFAGWDVSGYAFPHVHLNAGILKSEELPDLYAQCDVALVLSFSNMSLLPYEVMACGCAVVTNDDPCATWGLSEDVASCARATPESIAEAIVSLLDDPVRRLQQVERALEFVRETSWEHEIDKVAGILGGREEGL
jgi:glycosyltransferase involved in cell wall biosynthesis